MPEKKFLNVGLLKSSNDDVTETILKFFFFKCLTDTDLKEYEIE